MRPYVALGRRTSTLVAESSQSLCSKTARQSCKASGVLASGDTRRPIWAACGQGRGHGCQEAGLGAMWGAGSHSSSDCGLLHDEMDTYCIYDIMPCPQPQVNRHTQSCPHGGYAQWEGVGGRQTASECQQDRCSRDHRCKEGPRWRTEMLERMVTKASLRCCGTVRLNDEQERILWEKSIWGEGNSMCKGCGVDRGMEEGW